MSLDGVQTIGVIGLGDLGTPMAKRFIDAGFGVVVYDVRSDAVAQLEEYGADSAESPRVVAELCDTIHIIVGNDEQASAVMFDPDGIVAGLDARDDGGVIIVHSTLRPETVELFETETAESVGVLDAAVSGGSGRAREGTLTVMVGGDADLVDAVGEVLEAIGRDIHHLGKLGSGLVVKLTNNSILYAASLATLEALSVGRAYGIDEAQLLAVYEQSTGNNFFVQNFESYKHRPNSPLDAEGRAKRYRKNLYRYISVSHNQEVSVPLGGVVSQQYPAVVAEAFGPD